MGAIRVMISEVARFSMLAVPLTWIRRVVLYLAHTHPYVVPEDHALYYLNLFSDVIFSLICQGRLY